jgi:hypothetical protein
MLATCSECGVEVWAEPGDAALCEDCAARAEPAASSDVPHTRALRVWLSSGALMWVEGPLDVRLDEHGNVTAISAGGLALNPDAVVLDEYGRLVFAPPSRPSKHRGHRAGGHPNADSF